MIIQVASIALVATATATATQSLGCPVDCDNGWSTYDSYGDISNCTLPIVMIPEDNVNVVDGVFSACVVNPGVASTTQSLMAPLRFNGTISKRATTECTTGSQVAGLVFQMAQWGTNISTLKSTVITGATACKTFYTANCQEFTGFYRNGQVTVAAFSGAMVQNAGAAATLVQYYIDDLNSHGTKDCEAVQYCPGDPAKTFGIMGDTTGNFAKVQQQVKDWSKGQCVTGYGSVQQWTGRSLKFVSWPGKSGNSSPDNNAGTCLYTSVVAGDTGTSIAARCGNGMTTDALTLYNPSVNFSALQQGQILCCSVGKMPDLRPVANADGSCAVHQVASGDTCAAILLRYYPLTQANLMTYNSKTYGWMGCEGGHPWVGDKICVSAGTAPRPTANPLAECGPLAAGAKYLSECPLKACCSKDGFCGVSGEHCTVVESPTGAPGTKGCETNCDIGYVKGSAPAEFINVGYYETWSKGWSCMNGGILAVDWSKYTHIHYSFADIGLNLNVTMDEMAAAEFGSFLRVSGVKKVVSFGGWGISTDVATYTHLRNAMLPANVDAAVANVVSFLTSNGLDGIDIDWEYPGAPDIPGIPVGLASDAPNYLSFLKKLRAALPTGKSLSIAAPASYWYLKGFPIVDMSEYLDYVVYMTYDLHGQWDYGNTWTGNYLRSHVNWTETQDALALITHAGVPSNKLLLGLGAYGRSFKQIDPSCSGPMCKFTGPDSGATPGLCTGAAGYISLAEIEKLDNVRSTQVVDGSTQVTYGADQWVSYLTKDQMQDRTQWAKNNNMGGVVLWAADLMDDNNMKPISACNLDEVLFAGEIGMDVCNTTEIMEAGPMELYSPELYTAISTNLSYMINILNDLDLGNLPSSVIFVAVGVPG
ncbi:hypothetical protein GGF37_000828 [Kickxella alabastrina]|nr:hypothetical protein GGF37_000828 [Kickxella alabastrina]